MLSTFEAAQRASELCGLATPLTEKSLNNLLRRLPRVRPPVVAGRRIWRSEDLAFLVEALRADGRCRSAVHP